MLMLPSDYNINKFILVLQKVVYSYECMNDWGKFHEASLPDNNYFYGDLSMEDITNATYTYAKRYCKDFKIKHLGNKNMICMFKVTHYG